VESIGTRSLGLIDLVIGGSPCNDLTCVKRDRQGLSGECSVLFFDFVRVLSLIREESGESGSRVLFLFENVSSMRAQDRDTITRHLELPPLQINAKKLSAARRNRLYWLNFRPEVVPTVAGATLQSMLVGSGQALYEKAYCIRRRSASFTRVDPELPHEQRLSLLLNRAADCNPVRVAPGIDRFRKLNVYECAQCLGFPFLHGKLRRVLNQFVSDVRTELFCQCSGAPAPAHPALRCIRKARL